MKQLTNKQLADLREKWIFYCNCSTQEIYYAGLKPPKVMVEIQRENELVLRLIENAIEVKASPKLKKRVRSKYQQGYYRRNKEKINGMNVEYNRKLREDARAYRKLTEVECQ